MYDMDFRDYDPAIARWVVLDPVVHHSLSPYNAFDNNPVFWTDPSGADAVTFTKGSDGEFRVTSYQSDEEFIAGIESFIFLPDGDQNGDKEKIKKSNSKKEKYVQPTYIPAPKELPGFPGSTRLPNKKGQRPGWTLPDGGIGEWDSQHGEVEVYDKTGKKHKGAYNPETGEKIKDGDDERRATRAKFEINFKPIEIPNRFPVIKGQPPTPAQTATYSTILLITVMVLLAPVGI